MKDDDDESETCYWANHPKTAFWAEVEKEIKNTGNNEQRD